MKPALFLLSCLVCACGPSGQGDSDARESAGMDGSTPQDGGASVDAGPSADGMTGAYRHTITIDGINDFDASNETFASSSAAYTLYFAWDESRLYTAIQGPDIASGDGSRFFLVYLGTGSAGTTTGVGYNTQEPALPFSASHHLRWKADNSFTDLQSWSGSAWSDSSWTGAAFQSGDFIEMSIPLSDLGSPAAVDVHLSMINETNLNEFTYAAMPEGSLVDAYDPDYGSYYHFELGGLAVPTAHSSLP